MNRIRSSLTFWVALLAIPSAFAQTDSPRVLSPEGFLSIVRAYHPVVRAATLQVKQAEAGVQRARGAFDPTISGNFASKTLDGKSYYQYVNPQLSIPTWYGLELIGGMEDVRGERVNPEATVGKLSYAGIKLDITGIGLDGRRAALQQAKGIVTQTEAERTLAINDVLYEALSDYYSWQLEWNTLEIMNEALQNARERYRFVGLEYLGGARPAIDTIEALTQLQAMELQQSAAALAFANATLRLSNHLWLESGDPVRLDPGIVPAHYSGIANLPVLQTVLQDAADHHPKLLALRSKRSVLDVERRLKGTYLLPKLSVKATTLGPGYSVPSEANAMYLENNAKLAAEFRMPLFLREARGGYTAARLKVEEAGVAVDAAAWSIENKIRAAYNDVVALTAQLAVSESALANYRRLYSGERLKFEAGESTLFILNSRQNKVVEAEQKVAELSAKLQKAVAGLYSAAGLLR